MSHLGVQVGHVSCRSLRNWERHLSIFPIVAVRSKPYCYSLGSVLGDVLGGPTEKGRAVAYVISINPACVPSPHAIVRHSKTRVPSRFWKSFLAHIWVCVQDMSRTTNECLRNLLPRHKISKCLAQLSTYAVRYKCAKR